MSESKHTKEELKRLQALPLEMKIEIAEARILEFYHKMNGKVYVSFSGGKDSQVLLDLVRKILPDTEAVFSDTGLEFPELKDHIKTFENVTIIRPKMSFREVIEKFGYPLISKEVCSTVVGAKRNHNSVRMKKLNNEMGEGSRYNQSKWKFLLDAPFELNDKCCDIMKKKPFKEFGKVSGKSAYIGTTAAESQLREVNWIKHGCNSFTKGKEKSMPLSVWTEKDIWEYIKQFNLKIAKPYEMGYQRTGCVFCAFGAHLENKPNRFQMLSKTHPNLYEYMMKPKDQGGLGFKKPLEYVGVETEPDDQISIYDLNK